MTNLIKKISRQHTWKVLIVRIMRFHICHVTYRKPSWSAVYPFYSNQMTIHSLTVEILPPKLSFLIKYSFFHVLNFPSSISGKYPHYQKWYDMNSIVGMVSSSLLKCSFCDVLIFHSFNKKGIMVWYINFFKGGLDD